MHDEGEILQANQAFYTAFAGRDMAGMERIWARAAPICCIHPGWAPLVGRTAVIESWAAILSDPGAPEIRCAEARAINHGQSALVLCRELLPHGQLLASNLFVRENGAWCLVHHHAGPGPRIAAANITLGDSDSVH